MNEFRLVSVAERGFLALKRVEECDSHPCFSARVIALEQRERKSELTDTLALGPAIRALGKEGLVAPLLEHSQALVFAPTQDAQNICGCMRCRWPR